MMLRRSRGGFFCHRRLRDPTVQRRCRRFGCRCRHGSGLWREPRFGSRSGGCRRLRNPAVLGRGVGSGSGRRRSGRGGWGARGLRDPAIRRRSLRTRSGLWRRGPGCRCRRGCSVVEPASQIGLLLGGERGVCVARRSRVDRSAGGRRPWSGRGRGRLGRGLSTEPAVHRRGSGARGRGRRDRNLVGSRRSRRCLATSFRCLRRHDHGRIGPRRVFGRGRRVRGRRRRVVVEDRRTDVLIGRQWLERRRLPRIADGGTRIDARRGPR